MIISDYGAIGELVRHGVAADLAEAAALALNAGVDIDMMSFSYEKGLPEALDRGLVELGSVEAAVRRVLELKARLGLLADPYRRCRVLTPPLRSTARRRARRRSARRAPAERRGAAPASPLPAGSR